MNGKTSRLRGVLSIACLGISLFVVGASRVDALIFGSTGDTNYNTTVPSGALTNSGWQYEGSWGNYLGTPIAPQFFIVANHVGGTTNDVFLFNGLAYHPVAAFKTFDSDLTIWQVRETFPNYAPLYTASDETNKHLVVFGRGTQRGGPVVVDGLTNGWFWGAPDGVQRWGEQDVSSITNLGVGVGDMLRMIFDGNGGSNECHLSDGDSSGGVFIQDNGIWKLAGINHGVDGAFSNAVEGTVFTAALTDLRGLFQQAGVGPTDWIFINGPQPVPSAFYSTRISANLDWITSVIGVDSNRVDLDEQTTDAEDAAPLTIRNNPAGDASTATFPVRRVPFMYSR